MSRGAGTEGGELHGGHVVEGVVQLLADGLVLQFLGVQLIYDHVGSHDMSQGQNKIRMKGVEDECQGIEKRKKKNTMVKE